MSSRRPLSRCRYYNQDGSPIGRGCLKEDTCPFVHPTNPDWSEAPPPKVGFGSRVADRGYAGRGRGRGREGDSGKAWGHPPSTSSDNSGSGRKVSSGDNVNDNGWGSTPTTGGAWVVPAVGSSGHDSSKPSEGGWGSVTSGQDDTAPGWGNSAGKWGGGDSVAARSGESSEPGWGPGAAKWGSHDSSDRDPAPSKPQETTSGTVKRNVSQAAVRSTTVSDPRINRQVTKVSQDHAPQGLASSSKTSTTKPLPSDPAVISLKPIVAKMKHPGPDAESRFRGPKGRAASYNAVIKNMQNVVRFHIEYKRAVEAKNTWKRTQDSEEYHYSTPTARKRLDGARMEYEKKVSDSRKRLENALGKLLDQPEFQKSTPRNAKVDLEKIMRYTAEMRDWFGDLQLHRRIVLPPLAETFTAASQHTLPPDTTRQASQEINDPLTAQELQNRGDWTWKEIKAALSDLQIKVQHVEEDVYTKAYTTFEDISYAEAKVEDALETAGAESQKTLHTPDASRSQNITILASGADAVGEDLAKQAQVTAELLEKIHNQEQELKEVETETAGIELWCAKALPKFEQLEQWDKDDDERIRQLTEQLQLLHTLPRPPVADGELSVDEIMPYIRNLVLENIRDDITPVFDAFRQACEGNNERLGAEIQQQLDPILRMTEEISQAARVDATATAGATLP